MSDPIMLTAQLIHHRADMRTIFGDGYESAVSPFRYVLRGLCAERKQSLARVAKDLAMEMDADGHDPSMVFAAFVEEDEAA